MLLTYSAVQNDEKISHKNTSFDVEWTPGGFIACLEQKRGCLPIMESHPRASSKYVCLS